jgi:hypothetical protein
VVVVAVPASTEEMCETYYDYVLHLVRKQGIPAQDAPDVAHDILLRCIERDVLGMFDPEYAISHHGKAIPANFRTFLSTQVLLYVRGKRDALNRYSQREPLMCDRTVDGGSTWVELFGGASEWDDYSFLSAEEFVTRMRAYLASLPPRSARDRCDLVQLFDVLVEQGWTHGHIDYAQLQAHFRISPTSAYTWVGRLREALAQAPETSQISPSAPVTTWTIGGVVCVEADLREALEVLKSKAGGIMVKQPLEKAGCALAVAEKGWYHQFSAEEREAFPELEIDPATHKKPAGHVRKAVVHRLERMLAEAATPDEVMEVLATEVPDEPDAPEDLLEAELWRLGASAAVVDRIKNLAQLAYA